jgi:hypothetical protein
MQTLGTWLQLSGTGITGFGILFAWFKVSGRLRRWGVAAGSLVVQLRSAISRRVGDITVSPTSAVVTIGVGTPVVTVTATLGGTLDERLRRVENDFQELRNRLDTLPPALRAEMRDEYEGAIADALEGFSNLTNAARIWDVVPALVGVAVSIGGYICQLCA